MSIWCVLAVSSAIVGCSRPIHLSTGSARPQMSWAINTAGPDGREHIVCRSNGDGPCELQASTPSMKQTTTVHLYLHPSTTDITYSGTMSVTFMNGFAPDVHEGTIQSTVKPDDQPLDVSVTGPVTPIPGIYAANVLLIAISAAERAPKPLKAMIPVRVKETTSRRPARE